MKYRSFVLCLLGFMAVALLGYTFFPHEDISTVSLSALSGPESVTLFRPFAYTVVLDPGHGGEDGGSVSATGVRESDINLAISLKTELLLRFLGLTPVMTRQEDVSIHDEDSIGIAQKKRSDLHNRSVMVNQTANAVLISIHQNHFAQSRYYGAQVFYHGEQNRAFAELMQARLRSTLDADNERQAKTPDHTVYLLSHVRCPAILIECGFLSNQAELALLGDAKYQMKMAVAIGAGLLDWALPPDGNEPTGGQSEAKNHLLLHGVRQ